VAAYNELRAAFEARSVGPVKQIIDHPQETVVVMQQEIVSCEQPSSVLAAKALYTTSGLRSKAQLIAMCK
jgi:hypothetical protein